MTLVLTRTEHISSTTRVAHVQFQTDSDEKVAISAIINGDEIVIRGSKGRSMIVPIEYDVGAAVSLKFVQGTASGELRLDTQDARNFDAAGLEPGEKV